ncbi:hypothetical protein EQG41_19650 [Billgrantia azerbaijanica]|nr:hypothetical protein EQG41_19650 [Halomonas azerbaijanica]
MNELLSPFHAVATALVALLPPEAGTAAVGIATALGIFITLAIIVAPFIALGAWLEHRDRRNA